MSDLDAEGLLKALARGLANAATQGAGGLSGYERMAGHQIAPWTRGLQFTWIWEDRGLKWKGYEQFWFFRGTREYHLVYVPFFWRNKREFSDFEKTFIKRALKKNPVMSQSEFAARGRAFKRKLFLGSFQGPLVGAVAGGGGVAAGVATVLDKVSKVDSWIDIVKCESGDADSCVKVIAGFAMDGVKASGGD